MSQESVAIVRAALTAWNEGNMDAVRTLLDPEAILRPPEAWPEPGPYVGQGAVMREWEQVRETWRADAVEPISDFVHGADRVAVRVVWRTTGRGPESNIELTVVWTTSEDRISLIEYFWDHAEALEAAGLSDQDAPADS
jgi:ketosteroid isomerase-like protein